MTDQHATNDDAQAAKALVEHYRSMIDPASDPDTAIRDRLREF